MNYDPFKHAEDLGIEVIHRPIRTANGLWIPEHKLIVLRSGMKVAWQRSTLAHEIGHAYFGHADDRPKHEVQADRFAVDHLIDHHEFDELAEWVPDLGRMAQELEVTGRLLRVYLNVYRTAG